MAGGDVQETLSTASTSDEPLAKPVRPNRTPPSQGVHFGGSKLLLRQTLRNAFEQSRGGRDSRVGQSTWDGVVFAA